tara:strand:+ start:107 stop:253 length:147 start_codon:yes stop_codon:yes gene_type:complete
LLLPVEDAEELLPATGTALIALAVVEEARGGERREGALKLIVEAAAGE